MSGARLRSHIHWCGVIAGFDVCVFTHEPICLCLRRDGPSLLRLREGLRTDLPGQAFATLSRGSQTLLHIQDVSGFCGFRFENSYLHIQIDIAEVLQDRRHAVIVLPL